MGDIVRTFRGPCMFAGHQTKYRGTKNDASSAMLTHLFKASHGAMGHPLSLGSSINLNNGDWKAGDLTFGDFTFNESLTGHTDR